MSLRFNIFTGTFDYVGTSGGGGSGTLQNIDENGSVVVTNATVLNFVEPDATVITDAGGGQADVALSSYLLLAGRTGTTNDALISTTIDGTITGSGDAAHGLILRSSPTGPATGEFLVRLTSPTEIDSTPGFTLLQQFQDLTLAGGLLLGFGFGENGIVNPEYTLKSGLLGVGGVIGLNLGFEIRNAPGESQQVNQVSVVEDDSIITADGATLTLLAQTTIGSFQSLHAINGGALHIPMLTGLDLETSQGANVTIDSIRGIYFAPNLTGTSGDVIGLDMQPTLAGTITGTIASVRSTNATIPLLHTGLIRIGDDTTVGVLQIADGATHDTVLQAQAQAATLTYTTPAAIVPSGFLQTDAGGVLSWVTTAGGATGPQGMPGLDGLDGDEGWPGPPGVAGIAGAAGAAGATGPMGAPGVDGQDGLDWPPIPGPPGPSSIGATGPQGPSGTPGLDGDQGDDGFPLPGPIGPIGPTGAQGPPGPALQWLDADLSEEGFAFPGPTGSAGTTGTTGPQGAQGIPGVDGDEGPSGFPILGPAGVQGATGATGPQGAIGFGLDGTDGDDLGLLSTIMRHNDLVDLTVGDPHTQYAFLAGRSGGQTLQGDTAASGALTLASTANATKGAINVQDQLRLWTGGGTLTAAKVLTSFETAFTVNSLLAVIDLFGTSAVITDSATAILTGFNLNATISRNSSGAIMTSWTSVSSIPTLRSDALAITSGAVLGFSHGPQYSVINSGTIAGVNDIGVQAGLTVGASTTVATRTAFKVAEATGAGSVTNQIGMDIAALAKGGTLNVGVRSAIAASAGKNYFLRDTGGADSVVKGQLRLGDTTDPTAQFDIVGKTTINSSGLLTKYNNVTTAGIGMPFHVAVVDLTAQAAAASAAALVTPPAAGMYRVSFAITLTRAGTTSTLGANVHLNYTTGDGATALVQNVPMWVIGSTTATTVSGSTANTVGLTLIGAVTVYSSTTAMTYDVGYSSTGGTSMQYALRIRVEML